MLGLFLSILISAGTAAVVGAKMLGIARRTRHVPELAVGVGLTAFAVAQLGSMLAAVLAERLSPGAAQALKGVTLLSFATVVLGIAVFTVETFGRTAWRCAIATAIVLAAASVRIVLFASDAPLSTVSDKADLRLSSLAALTFALAFGWMGIEALRYFGKARGAYRIGLASPEVVSRFLVLGVGGIACGVLTAGVAASGVTGSSTEVRRMLILVSGLVSAATWVLTFMPPAAYRRFVESHAPPVEVGHG
jgi:hypothetical protein